MKGYNMANSFWKKMAGMPALAPVNGSLAAGEALRNTFMRGRQLANKNSANSGQTQETYQDLLRKRIQERLTGGDEWDNYANELIEANRGLYDKTRQQSLQNAAAQMSAAGLSRSGDRSVLESQRLADITAQQAAQEAAIRQNAYQMSLQDMENAINSGMGLEGLDLNKWYQRQQWKLNKRNLAMQPYIALGGAAGKVAAAAI